MIPRKHVATLNDLSTDDDGLVGDMLRRAAVVAREHGVADVGYRAVFNCNREAGQTVFHIHLHVLGGRPWPGRRGNPPALAAFGGVTTSRARQQVRPAPAGRSRTKSTTS